MKTLAIETSCDDTSVGIVSFDGQTFSVENLLAYSQIPDHAKYGGVVPEVASRLHSEKIIAVLQNIGLDKIQETDFISVTTHPGLPGSLIVGKTAGAMMAEYFHKPLVSVNHVYGHLFSLFLERKKDEIRLPMVVLTASGGHNDIYVVKSYEPEDSSFQEWHQFGGFAIKKIGYSLDDAAGECFDKVARMLGGPYPGGGWISEKSLKGKANPACSFKRIFLSAEKFEFSFSGMKSQVSYLLHTFKKQGIDVTEQLICDIAYEFQEAVVEVLVKKLIKAGLLYKAKTIGIAGGVSCNDRLREYLLEYGNSKSPESEFLKPTKKIYSTDNAAMIGLAALLEYMQV